MTDTIWHPLPETGRPKYLALTDVIRDAIAADALCPGDKLPPVRDLAYRLKITPGTVQRAYGLLVEDGVLSATVGRGTFVADTRPPPPSADIFAVREGQALDLSSAGAPDVGQAQAFRRALEAQAAGPVANYQNYAGSADDAKAVAGVMGWLEEFDIGPIAPEDVVLTCGAQHALAVVLQTTTSATRRTVLVEELSYSGFRHSAALAGAEVVALPMDRHGVDPDALETASRRYGSAIFCTSAEVQNPTTIATSPERRQRIAEIARAHDVQIVDDDTFSVGGTRGKGYRALVPERSWYLTSLSKTIAPGLRFGALVAPPGQGPRALQTLRYQTFGMPRPVVDMCAHLFASGDAVRLRSAVRAATQRRLAIAKETLGEFDVSIRDHTPFVWLRLPAGWRASTFQRAAEGEGILLRSADVFALRDGRAPNAVRISLNGDFPDTALKDGLATLARLLRRPPEQPEV